MHSYLSYYFVLLMCSISYFLSYLFFSSLALNFFPKNPLLIWKIINFYSLQCYHRNFNMHIYLSLNVIYLFSSSNCKGLRTLPTPCQPPVPFKFSIFFKVDTISPFYFYLFIFGYTAQTCRILIPLPGIASVLPVTEGQILNHWTAREVPPLKFFCCSAFQFCQVIFLTPQNQASFFVPNICLYLICLTISSTYWFQQEFLD